MRLFIVGLIIIVSALVMANMILTPSTALQASSNALRLIITGNVLRIVFIALYESCEKCEW
ncbi:MAG TPA: hypothetical protein VE548_08410 [Nitrososphaeraceae archaeon]|jgi:hypothetical protein|nr:hypothetical protein [Nitrososphaeraceae archaeon]